MDFLPDLIPDEDMDDLSNLLHEELDGYLCFNNGRYYCYSCASFETGDLRPVRYHNVSHFPPPHPPAFRCYNCSTPIALRTPLVDCRRYFLYYIEQERDRDLQLNRR